MQFYMHSKNSWNLKFLKIVWIQHGSFPQGEMVHHHHHWAMVADMKFWVSMETSKLEKQEPFLYIPNGIVADFLAYLFFFFFFFDFVKKECSMQQRAVWDKVFSEKKWSCIYRRLRLKRSLNDQHFVCLRSRAQFLENKFWVCKKGSVMVHIPNGISRLPFFLIHSRFISSLNSGFL